jgi:hypothetical protein
MKKAVYIISKVILSLMLASSLLGLLGVFPAPTRDLYNTDEAFQFIDMLMKNAVYINVMMTIVNITAVVAMWTKRDALAALLITPITANIVGFHMFLDGGLFTAGAIMANVLLVINVYLLWVNREAYRGLVCGK